MAKIEDLIKHVSNDKLREAITREIRELKKTKRFGLVFEEHLPETVRIPRIKVKAGELVAKKTQTGNDLWRVKSISNAVATLEKVTERGATDDTEITKSNISELCAVRNFGDPIYPMLTPIERIERGESGGPWHVLLNSDNFHALQLFLYAYENKVDVIYIDPPYNSGARDWKYNNDYVDRTDSFRHSKWLSMMNRRLRLAKRLLKDDGVIIVTIDENEVHHLSCLLESLFPGDVQQQVTIVINPKGVTQGRYSRVEEFALFVFRPGSAPSGKVDDYLTPEPDEGFDMSAGRRPRWKGLLRSGTNARREDRPNMFFPVLIDEAKGKIVGTDKPLLEGEPVLGKKVKGYAAAWPVRTNGQWGNWGVGHVTLKQLIEKGYVSLGEYDVERKTWAISYLSQQLQEQIEGGILTIVNRDPITDVVDVTYSEVSDRRIKTVWKRSRHDAGAYGSSLLKAFLGRSESFAFPKSLYAVEDAILPLVRNKKDAIILDFFAGSGTTFHATCLMNWRDGGKRQCISVTNNEVSAEEAAVFNRKGIVPGTPEYEAAGVANAVMWPRMKAVVTGKTPTGDPVPGSYLGFNDKVESREFSDGFEENVEFFDLDFVDPDAVERGEAFKAILPILWMVAGCRGKREDSKGSTPWFIAKASPFAVLIQEKQFRKFRDVLKTRKDIRWAFLITDSEEGFEQMRRTLGPKYQCVQLYKSYLDNFRINTASS